MFFFALSKLISLFHFKSISLEMKLLFVALSFFILFSLTIGQIEQLADIVPEDELSLNKQWEDYKQLNNKHYDTPEEEQLRFIYISKIEIF